jgi:hypothetical protein
MASSFLKCRRSDDWRSHPAILVLRPLTPSCVLYQPA